MIESAPAGPMTVPRYACRITEKAVAAKQQVYLHGSDQRAVSQINELLWTFNEGSFLAHETLSEHNENSIDDAPVWVGHSEPPEDLNQVIINLHPEVPLFFTRFERLIEFVPPDEEGKRLARSRYKFYRDRGYELESHKL